MTNMIDYVKNVAKSVGYSMSDQLSETAETSKAFITTNKETLSEIYSSMKNMRKLIKRTTTYIKGSKVYEAADEGVKAAFEDIRTGKFYNKERIAKFEERALGSMMDFDDEDFNFDNIDSDNSDFNDDSDVSLKGFDEVEEAVVMSSRDNAAAISNTVARIGSASIAASKANTLLLYDQQIKTNNIMEKGFTSIFDRIGEVNKVNFELASTHADNSAKFFESTTKLLQDQNTLLQQIVANQKIATGVVEEKKNTANTRITYNDVVGSNGEINIKNYAKSIKQNFKDALPSELKMLFGNSIGGEDGNLLLTFASSPLQFISNFFAKTLIPSVTKQAVKDFDNTLSGAFSGMLANFNKMQGNTDNDFVKMIGNIFGVKNNKVESFNTSNYNKGQMPWNGLAQKSLIEVIPGYLRRIEGVLTGDGERIYKWSEGKWQKAHDFKKDRKREEEIETKMAYSDIYGQMTDLLKSTTFFTTEEWKNINKNMESFLSRIINQDYGNPRFKKGDESRYYDYGVDDDRMMRLLINTFMATDRRERSQLSKKAYSAKNKMADRLNNLLKNNPELAEHFNGSDLDKGYNWDDEGDGRRTSAPGFLYNNTINKILDNKGHNVFWYLQRMYGEMVWFREAGYGSSREQGTPSGGPSNPPSPSRNPINVPPRNMDYWVEYQLRDDNADRKRRDLQRQYIRSRDDKNQQEAERKGLITYHRDDSIVNKIDEKVKKISREKYGNSSVYEDYINSAAVKAGTSSDDTWLNDTVRNQRKKRQETINKIDQRIKGLYGEDADYGIFDQISAAQDMSERIAVFTNSISNILNSPQKFFTNIMLKADERLYNMVFGDGETHYVNGEPVNSIMGEITYQIKGTFGKLQTWIDEKILNPFKEKGIHGFGDLFQSIGEMFGLDIRGTINQFKRNFGKGAKSIWESAREAASSARNFIGGSNNQNGGNNGRTSLADRRAAVNEKIISRHKKISENLESFKDVDKIIQAIIDNEGDDEFSLATDEDKVAAYAKLASIFSDSTDGISDIKDINDTVFITNFLNNIKDYRFRGKSLSEISSSASHDEYELLTSQILEAYNDKLQKDKEVRKNQILDVYSTLAGVSSDISKSNVLKKFASGELNENSLMASLLTMNPLLNMNQYTLPKLLGDRLVLSDDNKLYGAQRKRYSSVFSGLNNIATNFNKIDRLPADIQEYLDNNPNIHIEDLQNLFKSSLGKVSNDRYNKIIADFNSKTGKDIKNLDDLFGSDDNFELNEENIGNLNLLLKLTNAQISKANKQSSKNYNASLVNYITESINSGKIDADILSKLGINLAYKKDGSISAIKGTPQELSNAIKDILAGLETFQNAKGARYITKTGLTTIHEGEMVIPSELNPYNPNRGKVSKSTEIANENRVKNKFLSGISKIINSHANGDDGNGNPISGTSARVIEFDDEHYRKFTDEKGNTVYRIRQGKDKYWDEIILTKQQMAEAGLNLDPNIKDVPPEGCPGKKHRINIRSSDGDITEISTAQDKIKKGVDLVMTEAGMKEDYDKAIGAISKYGAAGAGGGLLGGAAGGLLLGGPLGIIGGALVGAIGNIARKSETVSNFLFGEVVDADGGRAGGIIDSEVQDIFKKYAPSMGKWGIGGALAGLITPFGPIGGALIGSTIGFMKNNEDFQGLIFGEEGIFTLEDKAKFKKALPRMGLGAGAGAIAGLAGGPLGILGGALVGSAGGFLTTTDKFKDLVLGKEYDTGKKDEDGNPIMERTGGVLGAIKKITVEPLKNGATQLKDSLKNFIQNDIIAPLKDGVKPLANMLKNGINSIKETISNAINSVFEEKLGVPIGQFVKDKILKPIGGGIKGFLKLPFKLAGSIISSPFKLLGFVGNNIRANQIKKGKDLGSTAAERLAWRKEHGIRSKKIFGSGRFTRDGFIQNDGYETVDENLLDYGDAELDQLINDITAYQAFNDSTGSMKNNTIHNIRDLITTRFNTSEQIKIFAHLRKGAEGGKGGYKKAFEDIRKIADKKGMTPEETKALITNLEDQLHQYDIISGGKNLSEKQITDLRSKLHNLGFIEDKGITRKDGFLKGIPGAKDFDFNKISTMLAAEKKGRIKDETWSLSDNATETLEQQTNIQGGIAKTVTTIADSLNNLLELIKNKDFSGLIESDENDDRKTKRIKNKIITADANRTSSAARTRGKIDEKVRKDNRKANTRRNLITKDIKNFIKNYGELAAINEFGEELVNQVLRDEITTRAYGRFGGDTETAVVSKDELIINPYDISTYATGNIQFIADKLYQDSILTGDDPDNIIRRKRARNILSGNTDEQKYLLDRYKNDISNNLLAMDEELLGDQGLDLLDRVVDSNDVKTIKKQLRAEAILMDQALSDGMNVATGKLLSKKNKNAIIAKIARHNEYQKYIDKINSKDNATDEEKEKVKKYQDEQINLLKDIRTYMGFETTDDGETFQKLISKKGQVYVNKHDPKNKLALKEGETNNDSNSQLKGIRGFLEKMHYGLFEKRVTEDGQSIMGVAGGIIKKIAKFAGGGLLVSAITSTLLKKIFGTKGEDFLDDVKNIATNKVAPAIQNFWENKGKPFFTETVPNFGMGVLNKLGDFGSNVWGFLLDNAPKVGQAAASTALNAGSLILKAAPYFFGGLYDGASAITGLNGEQNQYTLGEWGLTRWLRSVAKGSNGQALKNFTLNLPTIPGKLLSKVTNVTTTGLGYLTQGASNLFRTNKTASVAKKIGGIDVESILKTDVEKNVAKATADEALEKAAREASEAAATVTAKRAAMEEAQKAAEKAMSGSARKSQREAAKKAAEKASKEYADAAAKAAEKEAIRAAAEEAVEKASKNLSKSGFSYMSEAALKTYGEDAISNGLDSAIKTGTKKQYKTMLNTSIKNINNDVFEAAMKSSLENSGKGAKNIAGQFKSSIDDITSVAGRGLGKKLGNMFAKLSAQLAARKGMLAAALKSSEADALSGALRKGASTFGKKLAASITGGLADVAAKLSVFFASGGLSTVVFAIGDFLENLLIPGTAMETLGLSVKPTWGQRVVAGLVAAIWGAIPWFSLVPVNYVADILWDDNIGLGHFGFDLFGAGIAEDRKKTKLILEEFKKEFGIDISSYQLNQLNGYNTLWDVTGGKLGDAIFNNGQSEKDKILKELDSISISKNNKAFDRSKLEKYNNIRFDGDKIILGDGTILGEDNSNSTEEVIDEVAPYMQSTATATTETNSFLASIEGMLANITGYITGSDPYETNYNAYLSSNASTFTDDLSEAMMADYQSFINMGMTAAEAENSLNMKYGSGSGRYSQKDKSINRRFNKPGDSIYQDISTSGCGPIAATNLINRHIKSGMGLVDPNESADYVLKHGYKETNGGTDPKYFKDYFAKNGINSVITSDKVAIRRAIQNGQQVVLMGQNKNYGMGSTPYGPNPHYVVATGMDKSRIVIDNPENFNEYTLYDSDDTLKQSSKAIITNSKFGMGTASNDTHIKAADEANNIYYSKDSNNNTYHIRPYNQYSPLYKNINDDIAHKHYQELNNKTVSENYNKNKKFDELYKVLLDPISYDKDVLNHYAIQLNSNFIDKMLNLKPGNNAAEFVANNDYFDYSNFIKILGSNDPGSVIAKDYVNREIGLMISSAFLNHELNKSSDNYNDYYNSFLQSTNNLNKLKENLVDFVNGKSFDLDMEGYSSFNTTSYLNNPKTYTDFEIVDKIAQRLMDDKNKNSIFGSVEKESKYAGTMTDLTSALLSMMRLNAYIKTYDTVYSAMQKNSFNLMDQGAIDRRFPHSEQFREKSYTADNASPFIPYNSLVSGREDSSPYYALFARSLPSSDNDPMIYDNGIIGWINDLDVAVRGGYDSFTVRTDKDKPKNHQNPYHVMTGNDDVVSFIHGSDGHVWDSFKESLLKHIGGKEQGYTYINPTLLTELYKDAIINYEQENGGITAMSNNKSGGFNVDTYLDSLTRTRLFDFLRSIKMTPNDPLIDFVYPGDVTYGPGNSRQGNHKNDLFYIIAKKLKGLDYNDYDKISAGSAMADEFYSKFIDSEHSIPLNGAMNYWDKDTGNIEDFLGRKEPFEVYNDEKLVKDPAFLHYDYGNTRDLIREAFDVYNHHRADNISDQISLRPQTSVFSGHLLSDHDLDYIWYTWKKMKDEKLTKTDKLDEGLSKYVGKSLSEIISDGDAKEYQDFYPIQAFKKLAGKLLQLSNAFKDESTGDPRKSYIFSTLKDSSNSFKRDNQVIDSNTPFLSLSLDDTMTFENLAGKSTTNTISNIINEYINTIDGMFSDFGLLTETTKKLREEKAAAQHDAESIEEAINSDAAPYEKFFKLPDVNKQNIMLQVLHGGNHLFGKDSFGIPMDIDFTPMDTDSNGEKVKSKNPYEWVRSYFRGSGLMPENMFASLYLMPRETDSETIKQRMNNYFTAKFLNEANTYAVTNAVSAWQKLDNAATVDGDEIKGYNDSHKPNPGHIFKLLKAFKYGETPNGLLDQLNAMDNLLAGSFSDSPIVFEPLVDYMKDSSFNMSSRLKTLRTLSNLKAFNLFTNNGKSLGLGEKSITGKAIVATGMTNFPAIAFEDFSEFSNLSANEINNHIASVYKTRGTKRYKPFANKGKLFVDLAEKYKVNPRLVLAVIQIECGFCGDSDVLPTQNNDNAYYHDHYKNYQSLMDPGYGKNNYTTMHDFTQSPYTIKGVELKKCEGSNAFDTAIENVFKYFREISYKQRGQKTAFSLNFKKGYVYCGTSAWLNSVCDIMSKFSENLHVTYIYPTKAELDYFRSVEGKEFDESTLPDEPSAFSKIKSALLDIAEGIWGDKILEIAGLKDSSSSSRKRILSGEYTGARDFFSEDGLTDKDGNPSFISVTSNFGPRALKGFTQHMGIDMISSAYDDTNIYSPVNGTVAMVGDTGDGYGNKAVILDDGNEIGLGSHYHLFGHMSKPGVKVGDTIDAGDFVGKMGHTGNCFGSHNGTHLHYGVAVPNTNGTLDINNKYYEQEMPTDGTPNDGGSWSNVPSNYISSNHGWVDPDTYINDYMNNIDGTDNTNTGEGSGKRDQPAMGMGKSATEVLLDRSLKDINKKNRESTYQPAMGMGGSNKTLHLDTRAKKIVKDNLNGKGGSYDNTSELQTLKEISSILTSINDNTAKSNLFLAAFLKAVQNGEVSANSSMFTNIINALSGTKSNSELDDATSTLINTMTRIARQ